MSATEAAGELQVCETATMYTVADEGVSGAYLDCPAENQTEVFGAKEEKSGLEALRCALEYLW